jgi:hypothetical protein
MGSDRSTTAGQPLRWAALAARIGDFLRAGGVPAAQVERLSHAVVRPCADAADSMAPDDLRRTAMDEARTLLATWHATLREHLPAEI